MLNNLSLRQANWKVFSDEVSKHIKCYVEPQYPEYPDLAAAYTASQCVDQAAKYCKRFSTPVRAKERKRDLMKAAHYLSMAVARLAEECRQ